MKTEKGRNAITVTLPILPVLAKTLEILGKNEIGFSLLPGWYDIDRPEDLYRLKASMRPGGAGHLRGLLSTLRVFAS